MDVGSNFTVTLFIMTDEEILETIKQVQGLEGMTVNELPFCKWTD